MKIQSLALKIIFGLVNLLIFGALGFLLLSKVILPEIFLALLLLQLLISGFFMIRYLYYRKCKKLAKDLGFRLVTTGFLEQARFEGMYKKNWWQIHFASRPYGEYWGMPRTYIKLQYKEPRKFKQKILDKYSDYKYKSNTINSVEHVVRPYKNYLLMKVKYFIFSKETLHDLMNLLLKISKEAR